MPTTWCNARCKYENASLSFSLFLFLSLSPLPLPLSYTRQPSSPPPTPLAQTQTLNIFCLQYIVHSISIGPVDAAGLMMSVGVQINRWQIVRILRYWLMRFARICQPSATRTFFPVCAHVWTYFLLATDRRVWGVCLCVGRVPLQPGWFVCAAFLRPVFVF